SSCITFGRRDFDTGFLGQAGQIPEPAFAVGVAVADEGKFLDALLFHVIDDAARHDGSGLRQTEGPRAFTFGKLGRGRSKLHGFTGGSGFAHGDGRGGRAGANDDVDLVFSNQALSVFLRLS